MRIGANPNKNVVHNRSEFFHQIIIPVFIPNEEDYFKDSFIILKYHIESLIKTVNSKTYITVVNNGSCNNVKMYIDELFYNKLIQEVIHVENIGKVNAVLKGIVGHSFPIVTITDCDVMFLTDWQKSVYNIFDAFPKVGVVGLTPMLKMSYYLTSNVIFDNLFSKKMKFSKILNPDAMQNFYRSIGRENDFLEDKNKKYLTIKKNNTIACVGSGHYVATYKGDIFNTVTKFSNFKLGGDIEFQIDKLLLDKDYWRLTTFDNYAYHLGNTFESWMKPKLETLEKSKIEKLNLFKVGKKIYPFNFFLKIYIFQKIINKNIFRIWFEKHKREK